MRWVLDEIPSEKNPNGFGFFLNVFYHYSLISVGLIIGGIIAVFFILVEYFILKKKLGNNRNILLIRSLTLLLITLAVGIVHYILEKVIDVI